jgi:hypothetical protein
VIIVSTLGQEVVTSIGALIGVESAIATRMRIADGHYTGGMEFYADGEVKTTQVRDLSPDCGHSLPHLLRLQRLSDEPAHARGGPADRLAAWAGRDHRS